MAVTRKGSRKNRFSSTKVRRKLARLVAKHGSRGTQLLWQKAGNGYISTVTLWKIADEFGVTKTVTPGRPSAKAKAKQKKTIARLAESL